MDNNSKIKYLNYLAHNFNIEIVFSTYDTTALNYPKRADIELEAYINFNLVELSDIKSELTKERGFSLHEKEYLLQVFLHEYCHYKQVKKLTPRVFQFQYQLCSESKENYFEKLADRFALRYSKRINKGA